jgi:hypothetical protein
MFAIAVSAALVGGAGATPALAAARQSTTVQSQALSAASCQLYPGLVHIGSVDGGRNDRLWPATRWNSTCAALVVTAKVGIAYMTGPNSWTVLRWENYAFATAGMELHYATGLIWACRPGIGYYRAVAWAQLDTVQYFWGAIDTCW